MPDDRPRSFLPYPRHECGIRRDDQPMPAGANPLEIEMAHHGGNDNGVLPITFENFQDYGIDRHAISPAIRECEALRLIEITERGRAGNAEFRLPNKFRLTYRETANAGPTDDWRAITTIEQAEALARAARKTPQRKPVPRKADRPPGRRRRNASDGKKQNSSGGRWQQRIAASRRATIP
jgi:hypothetical protein